MYSILFDIIRQGHEETIGQVISEADISNCVHLYHDLVTTKEHRNQTIVEGIVTNELFHRLNDFMGYFVADEPAFNNIIDIGIDPDENIVYVVHEDVVNHFDENDQLTEVGRKYMSTFFVEELPEMLAEHKQCFGCVVEDFITNMLNDITEYEASVPKPEVTITDLVNKYATALRECECDECCSEIENLRSQVDEYVKSFVKHHVDEGKKGYDGIAVAGVNGDGDVYVIHKNFLANVRCGGYGADTTKGFRVLFNVNAVDGMIRQYNEAFDTNSNFDGVLGITIQMMLVDF